MKKAAAFLVICAGCIGLASVTLHRWHKHQLRRSAEAHAATRTRADLKSISLGLLVLCEMDKKRLVEIDHGTLLIGGTDLFNRLSQSKHALETACSSDQSASRGAFCDRWGHDIHGRITVHEDRMHVRLWSNGPNGQDEDGKNDDIVEEFDLNAPLE